MPFILEANEYLCEAQKLMDSKRIPIGDYMRIAGWLNMATTAFIDADEHKAHYLKEKAVRLLKRHTHIV